MMTVTRRSTSTLPYQGHFSTSDSATINDVMTALNQIQQNQAQILQAIQAVNANVGLSISTTAAMLDAVSGNPNVQNSILSVLISDFGQWQAC